MSKLQTDMEEVYAEAQEEGGSTDNEELMRKYWGINRYREKLKNDIFFKTTQKLS